MKWMSPQFCQLHQDKHITGVQFCPTNNGFSGPISFQLLSSWVMCEQATGSWYSRSVSTCICAEVWHGLCVCVYLGVCVFSQQWGNFIKCLLRWRGPFFCRALLFCSPSCVNAQPSMTRAFSLPHCCINEPGLISGSSIQGNPRNYSTIVSLSNQGAAERLEKHNVRVAHTETCLNWN